MPKPSDFDLDAEEIVAAAVDIFREQGLDAVSMRSVPHGSGSRRCRSTAGSATRRP